MASLTFPSASESPAINALLKFASEQGLDADALGSWMALLNAHPLLIGHDRIFSRMGSWLGKLAQSPNLLKWASDWASMVPDGAKMFAHLSNHSTIMAQRKGLGEFCRTADLLREHPMTGLGILRHPSAGAIWTRYSGDEKSKAALRADELQMHYWLAVTECRFRASALSVFPGHAEPFELPIAPMQNAGPGRALRKLCSPAYEGILTQLPVNEQTPEYARAMINLNIDMSCLDAAVADAANSALVQIQQFFKAFLAMLGGVIPDQRPPSPAFSRGRRNNQLEPTSSPSVYRVQGNTESLFHEQGEQRPFGVRIVLDTTSRRLRKELENAGLEPRGSVDPSEILFNAEDLKSRQFNKYLQYRAIESDATILPHDLVMPTDMEMRALVRITLEQIDRYLAVKTQSSVEYLNAAAAMMVLLSLAYGQPLAIIFGLQVQWFRPGQDLSPEADRLCFEVGEQEGFLQAKFLGISLPALTPNYESEPDLSLDDIGCLHKSALLLPDGFSLGERIKALLARRPNNSDRVFDIPLNDAKRALKKLFDLLTPYRLTPIRIQRILQRTVAIRTGDVCLSWILTADANHADEPRMYYAWYDIATIQKAYAQALRPMLRSAGLPKPPPCGNLLKTGFGIGARFVIRTDVVRQMVIDLKNRLGTHTLSEMPDITWRKYHNDFMHYSVLMMLLGISMRALNDTTSPFLLWRELAKPESARFLALSDKDTDRGTRGRLVPVTNTLVQQFLALDLHLRKMAHLTKFRLALASGKISPHEFYVFTDEDTVEALTLTHLSTLNKNLIDYDLPNNFQRSFIRKELLDRAGDPQVVDALLGHANIGENPTGSYSSFDYARYIDISSTHLEALFGDLGLVSIPSKLPSLKNPSR